LLTIAIAGLVSVLALLRLRTYPDLYHARPTNAPASSGHAYGAQLLVLVGFAVFAQFTVAAGRASADVMAGLRRVGRPLGIGLAVALALLAIVGYGLRTQSVEGWTEARLTGTADFISRQWGEFLKTGTPPTGTARLSTAAGTRSAVYSSALDGFSAEPLRGEGAGSFYYRWLRTREQPIFARNAHSLALETMSELGLVGLVLLVVFLGTMVGAAVRSRLRPRVLSRSQTAAVAGAVSVWIAHSMVDWDWQVTAFTGLALVLAAALYPEGRRRVRRRAPFDREALPSR
jgi:O-antigen ligase